MGTQTKNKQTQTTHTKNTQKMKTFSTILLIAMLALASNGAMLKTLQAQNRGQCLDAVKSFAADVEYAGTAGFTKAIIPALRAAYNDWDNVNAICLNGNGSLEQILDQLYKVTGTIFGEDCVKERTQWYNDAKALFADLKANTTDALIRDAYVMKPDSAELVTCYARAVMNQSFLTTGFKANGQCTQDMTNLAHDFYTLIGKIKSGKYDEIAQDLTLVYAKLQRIVADCVMA